MEREDLLSPEPLQMFEGRLILSPPRLPPTLAVPRHMNGIPRYPLGDQSRRDIRTSKGGYMRRWLVGIIVALMPLGAHGQAAQASATVNGSTSPQGVVFNKVNGFVPIVNTFPVIVGEVYHTGLTGSSFNNILYPSGSNPYTNATYKVICTLAVISVSLSYTDAATQNITAFNLSMGTVTLSTTSPTLINAVNFAASNLTSITYTTVLVSGTATYNVDCYIEAENHH
jgi:hypothetical protein